MDKIVYNLSTSRQHVDLRISNEVTVSIRGDKYMQLVNELLVAMKEDINRCAVLYSNVNKRADECLNFITDIRAIFYNECGDFLIKKDVNDIIDVEEKLTEMLEKYSRLLGLEGGI